MRKVSPYNSFDGLISYNSGTVAWFEYGRRHRIGAPAIEYPDGGEEWYIDGRLHRI